jgi:predicted small lipoprotein YifL
MLKLISILIISLTLTSCGNKKPNKLPEGVIDKSQFPFPPNEEYEYPEE